MTLKNLVSRARTRLLGRSSGSNSWSRNSSLTACATATPTHALPSTATFKQQLRVTIVVNPTQYVPPKTISVISDPNTWYTVLEQSQCPYRQQTPTHNSLQIPRDSTSLYPDFSTLKTPKEVQKIHHHPPLSNQNP